jgi:hypothetical protein
VPTVNYLVDPTNIFDDEYVNKMINGIRQGKNVTNISESKDREFREELVKLHSGETFDYIIVGSSRSFLISSSAFPKKKILNLGVTVANLEDLVAIYQLLEDFNVKYNHVILTADVPFLNGNYANDLWKNLRIYYSEYMHTENSECETADRLKKFYSLPYLHVCLETIVNGNFGKNRAKNLIYTSMIKNENETYLVDGSIRYGKEHENRSQTQIDCSAREHIYDAYLDFKIPDARKTLFDKVVKSYNSKGQVIFYLAPIHPIFYSMWSKDMPEIQVAASWIKEYAKINNIPVIGDFNPSALGLDNSAFYDGVH